MKAESAAVREPESRAMDAIADIHEALTDFRAMWYPVNATEDGRQVVRASVAHGFAGWALFHAYCHKAYGRADDLQRAQHLLERAISEASESFMSPTLFEGLAGVGWAAEHLRHNGIIDADAISEEIDDSFLAHLNDSRQWKNSELISGAAGLGVYALERWPHGRSPDLIAAVIEVIESAALRDGDSVSWFVPPEQMSERNRRKGTAGWWDLGIAHGITGIALFLLSALPHAPHPERVAELILGAIRFLQERELAAGAPSRFPAFMIPAFEPQVPSRLAWCYGDLGIALLFCRAGEVFADRALLDRGRSIARFNADRRSQSGVVDASLCHGAVGVGHLFRRLAAFDDELQTTAEWWFDRALDFRSGNGVAGFSYSYDFVDFDGSIEHNWIDNPGLLLGAAGIGLGLVCASSGTEPSWDRLFLLS